ncbi:hypothetical protein BU15DRAFT_40324 [Melanogaster broomeanus]|nr:hypothetical protein BU15DRAFT_40324 [Melanogaster broomeanus]
MSSDLQPANHCSSAVLTLRVWYLFSHNRFIRYACVTIYVGNIVGGGILAAHAWPTVKQEFNSGLTGTGTKLTPVWYLYLPSLIVHAVLFLLKIWRVMESKETWKDAPVLRRVVKEFSMAATVVSVCRAMLGIKSIAAMWHVDPVWLLNNAELSRVRWRRGRNGGELVVELGGDSDMDELTP